MVKTTNSSFAYVTYIRATPERLWAALTDPDIVRSYWHGMSSLSDWQVGSAWRLVFPDGQVADAGVILEAAPPKRLVIRWRNENRPELTVEGHSRCVIDIEPFDDAVRLTLTHTIDLPQSRFIQAVSGGWPLILSNLKSVLETGKIALNPD
jgi:uncharacterized protein YndB with AHSA1/START domain